MTQVFFELVLAFTAWTIFGWIWFELSKYFESVTESKPESNPELSQNRVPATDLMQEKTGQTRIILPLPIMWKPDQVSALLPDTGSMSENTSAFLPDTASMSENTEPSTTTITEEYVRDLENDQQYFKNQIGIFQPSFQNLSAVLQSFEEMVQKNERLEGEVKCLKETVADYESDSRRSQPQEKPDSDERQQLKDDNSKPKTDLETSALILKLEEIHPEIQRLTTTTNELNQKLQKTSLKNDELILKLATSRNMASTSQDDFHKIESKLTKELTEVKDQLTSQQKMLEEKEATLESTLQDKKVADQKVEEIHKLQLELAQKKILALTSINEQLQTEFTEMKRTTEVIKTEFRHVSEERDAAYVFVEKATKVAKESAQLADERKFANDLLQSNIAQLQTQLTAFESQIDELKKEKAVQLYNSSTWGATESQLRNEMASLKANTTQTQNETLSELERIKDENSLLNASLKSVKDSLAEKTTKHNELSTRYLDLVGKKSLLEVKIENLMKEAEDNRKELERLEQENEDIWDTHDAVLESTRKTEKSAEEQVKALSEALAALREAVKLTKDSAQATETERKSMNSGATKTEAADRKKGTWIGKLLAKRRTDKSKQYGNEYANLLETTGLQMVARAKDLQDLANNLKTKGKALKKKAKTLE